jgi:hypothetical protein
MLYCENANDHGILIRTGQAKRSITKWIRPDGGVGKHGWSPSGADAKETAPRLRLFRTRLVWIALRYHDGVSRVRYLLTDALSACGYGQRRRGAPAADASAEALIAVARHAEAAVQPCPPNVRCRGKAVIRQRRSEGLRNADIHRLGITLSRANPG